MVEFCPECGNMLRKKSCGCGYNEIKITPNGPSLIKIWEPPTPNIIYCKITATPLDNLKLILKKGVVPKKLKEVRSKLKKHLYTCSECLYYHEEISHCKKKNKYLTKDSICRIFEPSESIKQKKRFK